MHGDRRLLALSNTAHFWIRLGQRTQPGLDLLSERVLSEVTEKPRSLFQLANATGADPREVHRSLSMLERFGLLRQSGVTPTDILHVTGIFQAWDREAAERGVQILCEGSKIGLSTLAQKLEETMDRAMGVQILELLLSESIGPRKGLDGCEFCSLFLDQCFRREAKIEGLQFHAKVEGKVIGIGAPAHAFLPSVAEKLGTQAVIPFHAGVANAVGAITSAVAVREECFIKPYRGGFHLHASSGVAFFANLEEASGEGERRLRQSAFRKAKEAGADEVEVMIDSQEKRATTSGGDSVFIEKTIVAHAVGNPKIYHEDLPRRFD
jgi:N-methylhydantoinase A/oxoprolinase/acetone carboxylase beta subunit